MPATALARVPARGAHRLVRGSSEEVWFPSSKTDHLHPLRSLVCWLRSILSARWRTNEGAETEAGTETASLQNDAETEFPQANPPGIRHGLLWLAPNHGGHLLVEITRTGDELSTVTSPAPVGSEPADINALMLDHFAQLYESARREGLILDLWIGYKRLRDEVSRLKNSFPGLVLRPKPSLAHQQLRELAKPLLTSPAPAQTASKQKNTPPRLSVATDASAGRYRGMGLAAVSREGQWAQSYVDADIDIAMGEIMAIDLAVQTFPGKLVILTDSKPAISVIKATNRLYPGLGGALCRIRTAINEQRIQLKWVKGHSGNPLNEAADRLAVAARRGVQLGQDQQISDAIAERIVAEVLRPHSTAHADTSPSHPTERVQQG